ncbi:MAG: FAD-binding oxidoreductase [Pseudomonadales bacterium]
MSAAEPTGDDAILVIGGGLVGLCTALALQARGAAVRVVDRGQPQRAASFGNAGVLGAWSCVPQALPGMWRDLPRWLLHPDSPVALRWRYLPRALPWLLRFLAAGREAGLSDRARAMLALNAPVLDLYRRLLQGTGQEHLIRDCAYIHMYREAHQLDLDSPGWRLRRELGAPFRVLSGAELREVEPDVAPGYQAAVMAEGQGVCLNPGRLVEALTERFRTQGGRLIAAEVLALRPQGGRGVLLDTTTGQLVARRVVLAAGAWSARLLGPLGCHLPLEAERGYHRVFRNPGVNLGNIVTDVALSAAASSMEMGLRVAGTAEFAGLDAPPSARRSRMLDGLAVRMFPHLNTTQVSEWMAPRPSFPDSLPVIGTVPGHGDITLAFGHAHLGLTGAPMTGELAADLTLGRTPNLDLAPYDPGRF